MPKAAKSSAAAAGLPTTIATSEAMKLLMLSEARLRQLVDAGQFPKAVKGRYQLGPLVQGYIRFLKSEERRTSKTQADSALKAARQREIELRIAEKEGRIVDMEDVEALQGFAMATFRAGLSGIPAAVTRDLQLRQSIGQAIDGAISRFEQSFREAGEALRAGRDPLGTATEDDS